MAFRRVPPMTVYLVFREVDVPAIPAVSASTKQISWLDSWLRLCDEAGGEALVL